MTINERIKTALSEFDCEKDDINKLVALAYYIGREEAAKELADKYNALLKEQRARATACRYYRMALDVLGDVEYIYSLDYYRDMTSTFGADKTDL